MPPKKHGLIWEAQPHTVAKLEILKGYLNAYFPILGKTFLGKPILIIDGFAGPGEYKDGIAGSPLATLETAERWIQEDIWRAGDIHLAFIEKDPARFEHLKTLLESHHSNARIHLDIRNGEFKDGMKSLPDEYSKSFKTGSPLFAFLDPFGAKGVPFNLVEKILQSKCSEVFINLDGDGIARILRAGEQSKRDAIMQEIFGDDSWRAAMQEDSFALTCQQILALYIQRLRGIQGVKYVFPFEMQSKAGQLNYYLVFASKHYLGLEKMKEAMKRLDQTGDYCFSDSVHKSGQSSLMLFNDPEQYGQQMLEAFAGTRRNYEDLRDYALNCTPFTNPKSMLQALEKAEKIEVVTQPNVTRRRGTFKEDHIESIRFQ